MCDEQPHDSWYHNFDEVYRRFCETLRSAAEKLVGPRLRRRVDADDIVQSVFREYHQNNSGGTCKFDNTRALHNYLRTVMDNKVRNQAQFHNAKKRGVMLEESVVASGEISALQPRQPTPDQWVAATDEIQFLPRGFSRRDLKIVRLCAEGHTSPEVARLLRCSRWTVRRVLDGFGTRLQRRLAHHRPL
jgi:RNA polymerase sigma factor (sigma-70 family)